MWKYVGRRLKDSAEQTCSHIKNLRSTFSTCNTKTIQEAVNQQSVRRFEITRDGRNYNIWATLDANASKNESKKNPFDIDAPYIIQKCYEKQKQKQQQQAFSGRPECCSILQWTAGLLCSVYFGQMMCLYSRRRQNLKRWKHMEQLLIERSLKQSLIRYDSVHQRSYVPSNGQHNWYDADQMRGMRALMTLVPVTNEHRHEASSYTASTQTTTNKDDMSAAVDNLIATLGSIEFRLGMQNLRANEPEVAVSHLKSATTHRHPEATFNLGVCYELGIGIEKSLKNAMECYRSAAGLGHKTAMYNLGVFYVHGRGGLKKNRAAARACFEAANKLGLRQAQTALSIPERPVKKDEEIFWKSNDMISDRLGIRQRRQSTAT